MSQSVKKRKTETAMIVWNVPRGVRKKFKVACAEKDFTMRDVLVKLMEEYAKSSHFRNRLHQGPQ